VTHAQTDSQLLHNIIHGDDQTTVPTDGGDVKSVIKAIGDIEDGIQAGLTDLGVTADQLNNAVSQTETYRDEAQSSAQSAVDTANALNLPTNINGQAGKLLAIKQAEDGFEVIESVGVFTACVRMAQSSPPSQGKSPTTSMILTHGSSRYRRWISTLTRMATSSSIFNGGQTHDTD